MKKLILVHGVIAGLIVSILVGGATYLFAKNSNLDYGMLVGYASMLLAFSLIYVAIKNYRDEHQGGLISFGKAMSIGLLITLIASSFYVATWLFENAYLLPDFIEKYSAHMLEKAKASGATAEEIAKQVKEFKEMEVMYNNPVYRILFTYAEIVPVGIIVTLLCALLLKRKPAKAA